MKVHRNVRRGNGQALVEFAVALPLLLFIILGMIEVARWFQAYLAVQYAAREAARYAVTGKPPMYGDDSCEETGKPVTGDQYSLPSDYDQCRVDWIKHVARELARQGLLLNDAVTDITKPYYLGTLVRGSLSFSAPPVYDYPGVARTKIEVTVVYNHPVTNPMLSGLMPTIRTVGVSQMVNEPWAGGGADKPPEVPPAPPLPPLETDGDGWSDVYERETSGTLPSNPDTDGDAYCEGIKADWSGDVIDLCGMHPVDNYPLDPNRQ